MNYILERVCEERLDLNNVDLGEEYYYNSLTYCVIDAVFSISANYTSTKNTVIKYADYYNLKLIRDNKKIFSDIGKQEGISQLLDKIGKMGADKFASDVLKNKQRTSTTNGILKAEAVFEFVKVLKKFEVEYFQDIIKIQENIDFIKAIKNIPGQKSGISLAYFYMLAGDLNIIKPDRMVIRFLEEVLNRNIEVGEAQDLLDKTCRKLNLKYPNLTLRELDYAIWNFMKSKK